MVLDNDFNLMMYIAIVSGTGVSHVHPTMAIASDTLVIGWSMRDGSVDHRAPLLNIERSFLHLWTAAMLLTYDLWHRPDGIGRVTGHKRFIDGHAIHLATIFLNANNLPEATEDLVFLRHHDIMGQRFHRLPHRGQMQLSD